METGKNEIIEKEEKNEIKKEEPEINIEELQKKLEAQNDLNSIENEKFSHDLDNLLENIACLIDSEKNKIKIAKESLYREKDEFKDKCQKEILNYEREKEKWKENLEKAKSLECTEDDILDLNIGGTQLITTTRNTLCKYPTSSLAMLFSGNNKVKKHKGRYFIDRDGDTFIKLLD